MFINLYFVLTISYLQIKSYNVLNYNNCSTDWSLTLRCILYFAFLTFKVVKFEKRNYFHRLECKYPEGGPINVLVPSHYCASFQSVHQLPKLSFLLRVICGLSDAYFLYGYIVHDVWFKFVLSQYYVFINDSNMYFYKRVSLVLLEYTQLTKKYITKYMIKTRTEM
jgi:hypothetical protein